jgi:Domain of unknown function (DUF1887)
MNNPDAHICLLSEQPSPNICPLLDPRMQPREVVLVVTPQQRQRVEHYRAVLGPRGVKVAVLEIGNAFDTEEIAGCVEKELDSRLKQGQHILINATGGTKPMSIAAYMVGYNRDVPVFYVHDDQIEWLCNPDKKYESMHLQERLKLEAFLQIHGVEVIAIADNPAKAQRIRSVPDRSSGFAKGNAAVELDCLPLSRAERSQSQNGSTGTG